MGLNSLKVIHILSGLYQGGAESQLEKLINHSGCNSIEHIVISLKNEQTPLMQRFHDNNIRVYCLGFSGLGSLYGFVKLVKLLNRLNTSETIIQCWMYHANFFGLLAATCVGLSKKVVWNIRRTELPGGVTGVLSKLSAKLSNIIPVQIICCANAAKKSHIEAGYNPKNMRVIHNGIDVELFQPNQQQGLSFRKELDLSKSDFIIGMVGRYAPIKGHIYLLKAFKQLLEIMGTSAKELKLVLIGRDIISAEPLQTLLTDPLLKKHLVIVPERCDIHQVMPAFNLLCLPSESEGFPNVVAEAMACGVPALVTDVGDAAVIVDNADMVIPLAQVGEMAEKLFIFINRNKLEKNELSNCARTRIITYFSVDRAWQEYFKIYNQVINLNNRG